MQWLDRDNVGKFSEQSLRGTEPAFMLANPTQSVPFVSENPVHLHSAVPGNTGVVNPKPDARTSSVPGQDVIDGDLTWLEHLLHCL